jgi:hypothetical protein
MRSPLLFSAIVFISLSCSESLPRTYSTSFPLAENPISENGNWINGQVDGLDWHNVVTTAGRAIGTDSPEAWSDPTAVLTGTWGADQTVEAAVYSANQTESVYQEVEIRLRSRISAQLITGYEILFRCLKSTNAYMAVVRWNGALGDFSYLSIKRGSQYGVADGDVVKASIIGSEIKVYINGVLLDTVVDGIFSTGNPGIGFNFGCGSTYADFGFTELTASELPPPTL